MLSRNTRLILQLGAMILLFAAVSAGQCTIDYEFDKTDDKYDEKRNGGGGNGINKDQPKIEEKSIQKEKVKDKLEEIAIANENFKEKVEERAKAKEKFKEKAKERAKAKEKFKEKVEERVTAEEKKNTELNKDQLKVEEKAQKVKDVLQKKVEEMFKNSDDDDDSKYFGHSLDEKNSSGETLHDYLERTEKEIGKKKKKLNRKYKKYGRDWKKWPSPILKEYNTKMGLLGEMQVKTWGRS